MTVRFGHGQGAEANGLRRGRPMAKHKTLMDEYRDALKHDRELDAIAGEADRDNRLVWRGWRMPPTPATRWRRWQ